MHASVVLFDLDGTLADSLPFIKKTYRRVFDLLGLPWADGEVMRWIGRPIKDIAGHFAGGKEKEFLDLYKHYYDLEHDRYVRLFPGTLGMLDFLKQRGLRLGVVTSKGREGTRRTVELTGLNRYLDVLVTAQDVNRHKPFPDPIQKALALFNASPRTAIYVGDSYFDMQAGRQAGTVTLGVTWGMATREELLACEPDGLLESWADLTVRFSPATR
ncbi:MAG: HAD-IA family hydrolase [Bacillota bacterium]